MKWHERADNYLRTFARYYVRASYYKKLRQFRRAVPDLFRPCDPEIERLHHVLWKPLWPKASSDWFRFFSNVSGVHDPRYISEVVFYTLVERILNDINFAWVFADKNFYDARLGGENFPSTVLRCVGGDFLDVDYHVCTRVQAGDLVAARKKDIVVKPSIDSGRGKNVAIYPWDGQRHVNGQTVLDLDRARAELGGNFVVQERIQTHAFCSQFNPASVNTFRVMTLRLPQTEEIIPLKAILKMGVGQTHIDNENAGGINIGVMTDGRLNEYACKKFGRRMDKHPFTEIPFARQPVPKFHDLVGLATRLAARVPALRLLSFDMAILPDGSPKCMEINTVGQGLTFLQTFGGGLFGEHTDSVIDYCAANRKKDRFRVFRLFNI
jgi:hypothetical protein